MRRKLLQRLTTEIRELVGSPMLEELGWFDFLRFDCPQTEDPVKIAEAALVYMSIQEDGSWNFSYGVLYGILAFLGATHGNYPTPTQRVQLEFTLEEEPVNHLAISKWFESTYPPS